MLSTMEDGFTLEDAFVKAPAYGLRRKDIEDFVSREVFNGRFLIRDGRYKPINFRGDYLA